MNIEAALLVLLLVLFLCRKRIAKAARKQANRAADKLFELLAKGVKALGQAAWVLITEAFRRVVLS